MSLHPLCSDYNIANFDAIKLPELEVCFYTPRSGGVAVGQVLAQAQREDANTSCLRLSHHQWIINIAVCCFGFYSASAWNMICVSRRVWSNDHHVQMACRFYFQVALYSSCESSEYPLCVLFNEIIIKNPSALICLQVALMDRPRRLDGLILQ